MRRFRTRFVAVAAAAAALSVTAPTAVAAASSSGHPTKSQSGSKSTSVGPLGLVSDSSWNNPNSPDWCLNEDDYDQPVYSGALDGSYTVPEQLCGLSSDYYNGVYWDAGGIGVESDVYVVGQLTDLTVTAPDASVHHAVLVGSSTSKGTTTYHYAVCYVPAYSLSSDTGGTPLPGGAWQITLSGQISSARWAVRSQMTDVTFQQTYCPASEQNLVP